METKKTQEIIPDQEKVASKPILYGMSYTFYDFHPRCPEPMWYSEIRNTVKLKCKQ